MWDLWTSLAKWTIFSVRMPIHCLHVIRNISEVRPLLLLLRLYSVQVHLLRQSLEGAAVNIKRLAVASYHGGN